MTWLPYQRPSSLRALLRTPVLRNLHEAWSGFGSAWHLPTVDQMDAVAPDWDELSLAEVVRHQGSPAFRLVRVGAALSQRAGRPLLEEWIGAAPPHPAEDPLGGAAYAYGRCLATAKPSHEYGHFDFGDGPPLLFERLLLPLGQGLTPTHILCGAVFSGAP